MGELIFFAVIILFSILESIARARTQRKEEEGGGEPGPTREEARKHRQPSRGRLDDQREERLGVEAPSSRRTEERESAAGMIPEDIWEEIAGLATGQRAPTPRRPMPRKAPRPRPRPERPSPPAPAETPTSSVPFPEEAYGWDEIGDEIGPEIREEHRRAERVKPVEARPAYSRTSLPSPRAAHPVHRSHLEYGTDPSERAPSDLDYRPALSGNENAKRVRAMLRGGGGPDALRQAIILREVLGPPTGLDHDLPGDR